MLLGSKLFHNQSKSSSYLHSSKQFRNFRNIRHLRHLRRLRHLRHLIEVHQTL